MTIETLKRDNGKLTVHYVTATASEIAEHRAGLLASGYTVVGDAVRKAGAWGRHTLVSYITVA